MEGMYAAQTSAKRGAERREWPRINLNAQALLRFERIGPELRTRIVNASANGLFLAMEQPRPIGTKMKITVRVSESETELLVSGVVVHTVQIATTESPVGVGIFLTEVGPEWVAFCKRLAAQSS